MMGVWSLSGQCTSILMSYSLRTVYNSKEADAPGAVLPVQ